MVAVCRPTTIVWTRLGELHSAKDWSIPSLTAVQHFWIVVLSFQTGLCPDTLFQLAPGWFDEGTLHDGRRYRVPNVGVMKNMQPERTETDLKIFQQQMLPAEEPRFCAIAAYDAIWRTWLCWYLRSHRIYLGNWTLKGVLSLKSPWQMAQPEVLLNEHRRSWVVRWQLKT